jgi:hypothetical protein
MTETKTKTVTTAHPSIAKALIAFQAEMPTVGKDKVNPHFKSRYADIASITEDIVPVLAKHGLAFTCQPRSADNGYEIVGKILHETGESIEGALPLFGNDAQKIGSSITYARRYLLCALTGVVTGDEDDDGNMASTTNERVSRQPVSRAASAPTVNTDQIIGEMLEATTKKQVRILWEQYNVGGAPGIVQAKIQAHAATLPEE